MQIAKQLFIVPLVLGFSLSGAQAQGDAVEGEEIAREACTRCHDVDPGGPFKQHPPSFAAIAVYRSEEQIRGRIIFPPLHTAMPQMAYMLTPDNVEHLVAYIVTLENR